MKRYIISIILSLITICSLTSCYATYDLNDDMYSNVDLNMVFMYGTPYYYNGNILYYLYKDVYYYRYFYDGYWYYRPFRHVLPHNYRFGRPNRGDYRWHRPIKPNPRPDYRMNRHGNFNGNRTQPNMNSRQHAMPNRSFGNSSQRTNIPRGNSNNSRGSFGGRR